MTYDEVDLLMAVSLGLVIALLIFLTIYHLTQTRCGLCNRRLNIEEDYHETFYGNITCGKCVTVLEGAFDKFYERYKEYSCDKEPEMTSKPFPEDDTPLSEIVDYLAKFLKLIFEK